MAAVQQYTMPFGSYSSAALLDVVEQGKLKSLTAYTQQELRRQYGDTVPGQHYGYVDPITLELGEWQTRDVMSWTHGYGKVPKAFETRGHRVVGNIPVSSILLSSKVTPGLFPAKTMEQEFITAGMRLKITRVRRPDISGVTGKPVEPTRVSVTVAKE